MAVQWTRSGPAWLGALALTAAVYAAPDAPPRLPIASASALGARTPPASRDPVVRRLSSLLAGAPLRHGHLSIVPLHARRPSEARAGEHALPQWRPEAIDAQRIADGVLRLRHDLAGAVLIVPGMFFRSPSLEARLLHPEVIAADAPLHVVARTRGLGRLRGSADRSHDRSVRNSDGAARVERGLLHAEEIGRALGNADAAGWDAPTPRGLTDARPSFRTVAAAMARRLQSHGLRAHGLRAHGLRARGGGTVVGCVVLVAGQPVAAHCFASQRLFADAWPDLLSAAIRTSYQGFARGVPGAYLKAGARRAADRGRAVEILRRVIDLDARRVEVPGGGHRWEVGDEQVGFVGRGLVDRHGRVLYVGIFGVARAAAGPTANRKPKADSEEDPLRRKSGRFNPFRKPVPQPDRDQK